jgi:hypothetical protein
MGNLLLPRMLILCLMIIISSCVNDSSKKAAPASPGSGTTVNLLKALNITPPSFNEDTSSLITLGYTDVNERKAQTCSLSSLSKVAISQACACDGAGVCTVGIKTIENASGAGSFRYNVAIGSEVSSTGTATFTITALDDAPVTTAISPVSFKYNTQSIITLAYTDPDGDLATTCSLSGLTNVTVTSACFCSVAGVCKVGVTGTNNFIGSASFNYTVTANSVASNSSAASFDITGDPPVANNITPPNVVSDTATIITLSYTDAQNDQATTCTVSSLRNIVPTLPCACASGVCGVRIQSLPGYTGTADFKYTVTAAGQVSNQATANLTIISAKPVANNITPPSFNEDISSIITLSYTDPLSRKATACALTSQTNITVNQACACDGAGVCTVGVKGSPNYNGTTNFNYTVTAGGQVSNTATATLTINAIDDAPVVTNTTLMDLIYEDTESGYLTLNYTDAESDRAGVADCTITNPSNLTVTTPCSCDVILGTCSLKITGNLHYYGVGGFDYKIRANSVFSNVGSVSLTILHKDHAPVSTNITPPAFNEEVQSIITLSYTDIDNDKASTCTLSSLGNVTVTQACACNGAGVCTVGVTGTTNYNGAGSFYYTVTANGTVSNQSTASLTINNVDDAPVTANIIPPGFDQNVQSIITLSNTDPDNDKATTCAVTAPNKVSVTQACACNGAGICTVGVTGDLNYSGMASFAYTVTANGVVSNSSTANLAIDFVNTPPTIDPITATIGNENTAYVVNLSVGDIDGPLSCSNDIAVSFSSNTSLIPLSNVVFSGAFPTCIATITPANNQYGSSNLTFKITDNLGGSNQTSFIHTVRHNVSKTWLLGDAGDTNTYSYSSASIETAAPGVIRLTPMQVDQTDDNNSGTGFTAYPTTLRWDGANSRLWQNHNVGAWTNTAGVYSTLYTSRVIDAKKSVTWNSIGWKTTLPFGKELPLTNESSAIYSLTSGSFANSLIGLWHFNDSSGSSTVKNSKTGNNDSFLLNTPVAATFGIAGKFNTGMSFGGDSVIRSATSAAVIPGSFSVSTWIKKTGNTVENIICFWKTNNNTTATDCPVRMSNVIRVRIDNSPIGGNTNVNDGNWHHYVVYSDSVSDKTEVYIDGVRETWPTQPTSFNVAGSSVYIGSDVGNGGSFTGSIDETAIWNRVLSVSEITELYRRGANRLKIAVRTCPDATCSTNPAWSANMSELDNISGGEAITANPMFAVSLTNQRYFQYRATFETDELPTVHAPDLREVVVGPNHIIYAATEEAFTTQEGLSFKTLSQFTSTLGSLGCAGTGGGVRYHLSKDKVSWSYYNGSAWSAGTNFATASTQAQIQSGLATYISASNAVSDTVYVRGILKSDVDGASPCEVDQLYLQGFE